MCDLRATFLADLVRKLFFDIIFFLGVCGSTGLCNSSSVWEMRIQKRSSGHLRGAMLSDELLHPRVAQSVFARNFPSDTVTEGWQDRCDRVFYCGGMGDVARHPRDISKTAGICCDTKSPKSLLHHPNSLFHRCKGFCAGAQKASCLLGLEYLLHPLQTTFGDFPFSGIFPSPWLPNAKGENSAETPNFPPPLCEIW